MKPDKRILVIRKLRATEGHLFLDWVGELREDAQGHLEGSGLDLLCPDLSDVAAQARLKGLSQLEWMRRKLSFVSYLKLEIR